MPNPAGAHSLGEILSQPEFWGRCLAALEKEGALEQVRKPFRSAQEWLFIGCGSSYYIALAAAASWSAITQTRARAIPASELLLFPEIVLAGAKDVAAVVISRSGQTSEAVRAAQQPSPQSIVDSLRQLAASWQCKEEPADDQTVMVVQRL